ncbi:ATP synthase gamma chain, chloroplastic-like [Bidens hawaiensis]|uniref:ATP synthase gamma chain, chloroplastic-like n=1 Tax=Bidens hawaiensis TaxID=980011 RepID=UPI004049D3ED
MAKRLDDVLHSFVDDPPFTLQRLYEIILDAPNLYSNLSKLVMAFEKYDQPNIPVDKFLEGSSFPTAKEAQVIVADDVFSLFVSKEVNKIELLYTKFVSLVKSDPVIHTNGVCADAAEDELFRLTTKEGKLTVERDVVRTETIDFSPILQFEQDADHILDALLPWYLSSQILKALHESLASELVARMTAMGSATDNATELKKNLSRVYNRQRQAKITGGILEIVAGADALA